MTDTAWSVVDVVHRVVDTARERRASLVADLQAVAAQSAGDASNAAPGEVSAERIADLFMAALCGDAVTDHPAMREIASQAGAVAKVFGAVRLAEQCLEAELSLNAEVGALSEHWPVALDAVRGASYAVLAAYCERRTTGSGERTDATEPRLLPRAIFDIAVAKEIERSLRYGHPIAVILFRMDSLDDIRRSHGRGVAQRVLERVEVFLAGYFRGHDWVAEYGDGQVAVLLPETMGQDAEGLANASRTAIGERLVFPDRHDRPVGVTVSACVLAIGVGNSGAVSMPELRVSRLMQKAEQAVTQADAGGGNRVARLEVARPSVSVHEAAALLHCGTRKVRALAAAGTLPSVETGHRTRIDRSALEAYGRRTRTGQRRE